MYTLAALGMGLAWMWLKALVKGLHLVKATSERFPGRLAALWTVLNFGGNAQQPAALLSEKRQILQNCEVKFGNTRNDQKGQGLSQL